MSRATPSASERPWWTITSRSSSGVRLMLTILLKKITRTGGQPNEERRAGLQIDPFDIVVSSSVCAFLDDYAGTVATLTNLLKPGGSFVQWDWELNREDSEPFGLTRAQVVDALTGGRPRRYPRRNGIRDRC